jgi:hypothetical protein
MIETPRDNEQPAGSSDRAFGIVFAVFFAIVGLWPLMSQSAPRAWSLALAAVFLALAFFVPRVLHPLNGVWLRFGDLLHRIVSPIALGLLFFVVVTPTGWIMRALGKDMLRLRRDPAAASYWIERKPPGPAPDSLKDPF